MIRNYLLGSLLLLLLVGCHSDKEAEQPKPVGYFRLELPSQEYQKFDTTLLPFTFDYSQSAYYEVPQSSDTATWVLIHYPKQNASIEMLYKWAKDSVDLTRLMLADRDFVEFHYQKASGVTTRDFRELGAKEHVSGLFYDIYGKEVACPFHYWMTDEQHNFMRATLYFHFTPNNDSVQPVINSIREDALRMIQTFEWKNNE